MLTKTRNWFQKFSPRLLALIVLLNGLTIIIQTLFRQIVIRHVLRVNYLTVDISLVAGLSLIYLSALLEKRKRNAWFATILVYSFYFGSNLDNLQDINIVHHVVYKVIARYFVLPIIVLILLLISYRQFVVKSDYQTVVTSLKISLIVILILLVYGTTGFYFLGKHDFHQHLSVWQALYHTVDQLGLTTNLLTAYSPRGHLFQNSLSIITIFGLGYIILSFFQPIKSHYYNYDHDWLRFKNLLQADTDSRSEDYFKLWPKDKNYFFDSSFRSALAYRVESGQALILGDPTGDKTRFKNLIQEFDGICFSNDWKMAFIHTEYRNHKLYESEGYNLQKIGQEAVLDIDVFIGRTVHNKYFKNILNRFRANNYSYELLNPPYDRNFIMSLKNISDNWLRTGGHAERGFAMGYFDPEYINNCQIMVVRNAQNKITAFLNLIPANFDQSEATYDLLRYDHNSLSNVNDYLLINVINELKHKGFKYLNLGLCPLAGFEDDQNSQEPKSIVDVIIKLAYDYGDRFYSFRGLYRFKKKYEPVWRNRYIVYKGGLRSFSRVNNALIRTMRKSVKLSQ